MYSKTELNRLYRYCRALCDNSANAFDLLQQSIEKCLKRPPKDMEALHSYTLRVIRNSFIDDARSKQRRTLEEFDERAHTTVDHDLQSLESMLITRSELDSVWLTLSPLEREIIFLSAVEGYSTSEISALIDKPKNSILSIVHRMRIRLSGDQNTSLRGGNKQ